MLVMSQNVASTPPSTSLHYITLMLPCGTVWDSEEQGKGTPMFFQEAMFISMTAVTQWIHTHENKGPFLTYHSGQVREARNKV
jgi:hypothetical protein